MSARLQFFVRGQLAAARRLLESWRLSVVLMLLVGLYHGLLAIWARSSPAPVVQSIAGLLPFWLVYVLLILNTGLCLWRRLPALLRSVSRAPLAARSPPRWEAAGEASAEAAVARLRRLGYRPALRPDGSVTAARGRLAALGTILFHLALLVVAAGFLVSYVAREETTLWAAAGEEVTASPEQLLGPPIAAARSLRFRVEDVRPEFWKDELLFTRLEADLVFPGGRATTRINRPLWLGWSDFLRLAGFGYAPRYELLDREGRVLESAFVKLNVFPPGRSDSFRLQGYPHRVIVEVIPDLGEDGGSRSLNLVRPGVVTRVFRGKLELATELLTTGRAVSFEGLSLRFPEIRAWGQLTLVHDPGAGVILVGFVLALIGLGLRAGGKRAELAWSPGPPPRWRGWGAASLTGEGEETET